jgi:lysyl endopeptidase
MMYRTLWIVLLLTLTLSAFAQSTLAQTRQAPTQRWSDTPLDQQTVPSIELPTFSEENRNEVRSKPVNGPLQYGIVEPVNVNTSRGGRWSQWTAETAIWRTKITAPGALNMSAALEMTALPDGAEVYLYGRDYNNVRGPYQADHWRTKEFWTPHVQGEDLYLEVTVPSARKQQVSLRVTNVVRGFLPMDQALRGQSAKAGACNIDVACAEADPWRDQVDSVVSYTFNGFVCTGSLVNTTSATLRPYVLTAEHCISNASEANSMVFYFNYQNPTCRTPGSAESEDRTEDDRTDQTLSGATLRMANGNTGTQGTIRGGPDVTLVEINEDIPSAYGAFYNGWSIEDRTQSRSVTIHHPQGDGKRISFEEDPTTITSYLEASTPAGATHFRVADWDEGTTEGGSSGSPLYDENQRVVGVLSGGFALCGNDAPDWYGRISEAWTSGPDDTSNLQPWLDPGNTGSQTVDGRRTFQDPDDDTLPGNISDLVATPFPDQQRVMLSWTAPGDDGDTGGSVLAYEIRYSSSPIRTPTDFGQANRVFYNDEPSAPGSTERLTIALDLLDTPYYFAVRAVDDGGNQSSIAATSENLAFPSTEISVQPPSPNPASRTVSFQIVTDENQQIRIEIYDILGRRVRVLFDDTVLANRAERFQAVNVQGLSSGRYFLRVTGESRAVTEPFSVVK